MAHIARTGQHFFTSAHCPVVHINGTYTRTFHICIQIHVIIDSRSKQFYPRSHRHAYCRVRVLCVCVCDCAYRQFCRLNGLHLHLMKRTNEFRSGMRGWPAFVFVFTSMTHESNKPHRSGAATAGVWRIRIKLPHKYSPQSAHIRVPIISNLELTRHLSLRFPLTKCAQRNFP